MAENWMLNAFAILASVAPVFAKKAYESYKNEVIIHSKLTHNSESGEYPQTDNQDGKRTPSPNDGQSYGSPVYVWRK